MAGEGPSEFEQRLLALFQTKATEEDPIIETLDKLFQEFGRDKVQQWFQGQSKQKNQPIHEFVRMGWSKTLEHAVKDLGFDMNTQRQHDGNTALHLAKWYKRPDVAALLLQLGADQTVNNYGEVPEGLDELKEQMSNIIWLDTELTSLDDPHILECAVIITDKNLQELERGQWVVHYERSELEKLGEFHQKTFKSRNEGGNGLFDDCVASSTTEEEMEEQLLALLKRRCPSKGCPLAGSSIHWDREVVRLRMPSVYNHLHHRIIDVSSFAAMAERWTSLDQWLQHEKEIDKVMQEKDTGGVHRAMWDIERSIEVLKLFKACFAAF